jgi:hypothetical protein
LEESPGETAGRVSIVNHNGGSTYNDA